MRKPIIFVFVDWYLPAFKGGGIISCLASLIKNLEPDHIFKIFTRNTDFGSTKPFANVVANKWTTLNGTTKINYSSLKLLNLRRIFYELKSAKYNAVYINSVFSFYFSIIPLLYLRLSQLKNIPVIIAPMGMLSPGALKFKRLKKEVFLWIMRSAGFYKNVMWHASSQMEKEDIIRVFGDTANIYTASYLFNPSHLTSCIKNKQPGSMDLVYISRIYPKKNLLGALRFLQQVSSTCKITLGIYGPIEDKDYWQQCKAEIKKMPSHIKCHYLGTLKGHAVINAFKLYHFSILPTHSENYGQVIPESLAAGTPVILSDQTPWQNFEQYRAGWIIPFAADKQFVSVIEQCAHMTQEEYDAYNKGAFNYAVNLSNNPDLAEDLKQMFKAAIIPRTIHLPEVYVAMAKFPLISRPE